MIARETNDWRNHRFLFVLIVMTAMALALGACGRKGSPKPPPGTEAAYTYPQTYPAADTTKAVPAGQDPQDTRGPLSIFQGPESETAVTTGPEAEPKSILVLPPREPVPFGEKKGTPSVVPKSRTKTTTY